MVCGHLQCEPAPIDSSFWFWMQIASKDFIILRAAQISTINNTSQIWRNVSRIICPRISLIKQPKWGKHTPRTVGSSPWALERTKFPLAMKQLPISVSSRYFEVDFLLSPVMKPNKAICYQNVLRGSFNCLGAGVTYEFSIMGRLES